MKSSTFEPGLTFHLTVVEVVLTILLVCVSVAKGDRNIVQ